MSCDGRAAAGGQARSRRGGGNGAAMASAAAAVLALLSLAIALALSDAREAGWEPHFPLRVASEDPNVGPGDNLPRIVLRDLDGEAVRLPDYAGGLPLVIEFGSLT